MRKCLKLLKGNVSLYKCSKIYAQAQANNMKLQIYYRVKICQSFLIIQEQIMAYSWKRKMREAVGWSHQDHLTSILLLVGYD